MKKILNTCLVGSLFFSNTAACSSNEVNSAKPIVVAVIDTGLDIKNPSMQRFLCKKGHADATGVGIEDVHGHGTHISGIIDRYAGDSNYCQVIIKFWDPNSKQDSVESITKALSHAIALKVDIINISAGGTEFSNQEKLLIKKALDIGIRVVVAAGNNGCKLGEPIRSNVPNTLCTYFPAMYDSRLIVVGNLDDGLKPNATSNAGNYVNAWEIGTNVVSLCPNGKSGCKLTGTSQAAAVKTGKIINSISRSKK